MQMVFYLNFKQLIMDLLGAKLPKRPHHPLVVGLKKNNVANSVLRKHNFHSFSEVPSPLFPHSPKSPNANNFSEIFKHSQQVLMKQRMRSYNRGDKNKTAASYVESVLSESIKDWLPEPRLRLVASSLDGPTFQRLRQQKKNGPKTSQQVSFAGVKGDGKRKHARTNLVSQMLKTYTTGGQLSQSVMTGRRTKNQTNNEYVSSTFRIIRDPFKAATEGESQQGVNSKTRKLISKIRNNSKGSSAVPLLSLDSMVKSVDQVDILHQSFFGLPQQENNTVQEDQDCVRLKNVKSLDQIEKVLIQNTLIEPTQFQEHSQTFDEVSPKLKIQKNIDTLVEISNMGANQKIATPMMDKNSEYEDSNGPSEVPDLPQANTKFGEVKDKNGQIIERHVFKIDDLYKKIHHQGNRTNIFQRPESNQDKSQIKGKNSKGGIEFHSFSQLRSIVQKEKDELRSNQGKLVKKAHIGPIRKSSMKLLDSLMSKIVSDSLRDYYSLPASHNSLVKLQQQEMFPDYFKNVVLEETSRSNDLLSLKSKTSYTQKKQQLQPPKAAKMAQEDRAFKTITEICEKSRSKPIVGKRSVNLARSQQWRTGTKVQFQKIIQSLRSKLKVNSNLQVFKDDIGKRKEMLKSLNQEERRLNENFRVTEILKKRTVKNLKDYSHKYNNLISSNILLIQRWWRGHLMRQFCKNKVKEEIKQNLIEHQAIVQDMVNLVQGQEKDMRQKIADIAEKGDRNKEKEIMENRIREIYQLKKSEAIIKFEIVMSSMVRKAAQELALKTLVGIEKPLFNEQFGCILDQLSSYYQNEITTPKASNSFLMRTNGSNKKINFMPSLADLISREITQGYNKNTKVSQTSKMQRQQKKEEESLRIIKNTNKKPSLSKTFSPQTKLSQKSLVEVVEVSRSKPQKRVSSKKLVDRYLTVLTDDSNDSLSVRLSTLSSNSLSDKNHENFTKKASNINHTPTFINNPAALKKATFKKSGRKSNSPTIQQLRRGSSPNVRLATQLTLGVNQSPNQPMKHSSKSLSKYVLQAIKEQSPNGKIVSSKTLIESGFKQLGQNINRRNTKVIQLKPTIAANKVIRRRQTVNINASSLNNLRQDSMIGRQAIFSPSPDKNKKSFLLGKPPSAASYLRNRQQTINYTTKLETTTLPKTRPILPLRRNSRKVSTIRHVSVRRSVLIQPAKSTMPKNESQQQMDGQPFSVLSELNPCSFIKLNIKSTKENKSISVIDWPNSIVIMSPINLETVQEVAQTSLQQNKVSDEQQDLTIEEKSDDLDTLRDGSGFGYQRQSSTKGARGQKDLDANVNKFQTKQTCGNETFTSLCLTDISDMENKREQIFMQSLDRRQRREYKKQQTNSSKNSTLKQKEIEITNKNTFNRKQKKIEKDDPLVKVEVDDSFENNLNLFSNRRISNTMMKTCEDQLGIFDQKNKLGKKTKSKKELIYESKVPCYKSSNGSQSTQRFVHKAATTPTQTAYLTDERQKYNRTSDEQTAYIKRIVAKHSKNPQNNMQTFTKPLSQAFEDLDDLSRLFSKTGNYWNPVVIHEKDQISARITRKQMKLLKERQQEKGIPSERSSLHNTLRNLLIHPDSDKRSPQIYAENTTKSSLQYANLLIRKGKNSGSVDQSVDVQRKTQFTPLKPCEPGQNTFINVSCQDSDSSQSFSSTSSSEDKVVVPVPIIKNSEKCFTIVKKSTLAEFYQNQNRFLKPEFKVGEFEKTQYTLLLEKQKAAQSFSGGHQQPMGGGGSRNLKNIIDISSLKTDNSKKSIVVVANMTSSVTTPSKLMSQETSSLSEVSSHLTNNYQ